MRMTFRWSGQTLEPSEPRSDAYLRAWEYEPAESILAAEEIGVVRLWRTRRPDLAPAEIWVADRDM